MVLVPEVNILRPEENGHHFVNYIFKCIFWKENVLILIQFSVEIVPKGSIVNNAIMGRYECILNNFEWHIIWSIKDPTKLLISYGINLIIIGSVKGLFLVQSQVISWTNTDVLSIRLIFSLLWLLCYWSHQVTCCDIYKMQTWKSWRSLFFMSKLHILVFPWHHMWL